jgi:dTMP kinase
MAFLQEYLRTRGVDIVVTREPGGTRLGEDIREMLLRVRDEQVCPMTELLLIFAARAQHISERIEPALAAGKWVLCDRFTDATYAYQSGGRGMDADIVRRLEELVQGGLRPDFTLLLDAPVSTGMARARGRGELDRFEREALDFFERVRDTYLHLAQGASSRYRIIDASVPLAEVQRQLTAVCQELLPGADAGHTAS